MENPIAKLITTWRVWRQSNLRAHERAPAGACCNAPPRPPTAAPEARPK